MDKELHLITRSMHRLIEQQMTLPSSELQQKSCYRLVSTAKGIQDSSWHLRSFWTSVLPAVASGITWQFSNGMGSTTLFSPFWFPIALAHDPTLHSSPLTSGLCFQRCFQIFRYCFYQQKLLSHENGSSESWYILHSAARVFHNSLMSSSWALLSWPLEATVPTSLPLSSFQSSTILAENLVHMYNRYQTERLSFYRSICLSSGIPQGTDGFLCAFCTKVALVEGDFVLCCFQHLEDQERF